jgi:hypothetical protein
LNYERDQKQEHIDLLENHIKELDQLLQTKGLVGPPYPTFEYKSRPHDEMDQESSDDD